jgi:hypothetical protein
MSRPALSRSNENVFQRLGVRTIVNASGPSTRLSGGIMRLEVAEAMAEASQWCVDLAELQGRASEILAEVTGADAGYVTAGASAALMLASAACLAGLDPASMNRLPDTTRMANEVVMVRSQRNMTTAPSRKQAPSWSRLASPTGSPAPGSATRRSGSTRLPSATRPQRSCGSPSRTPSPA